MGIRRTAFAVLLAAGMAGGLAAVAEDATAPGHPLEGFERLIGGEWHGDGTYSTFEWGVGKRSVRSRQYFVVNGETRLVGEGAWFWHPGERAIRGVFTAVDMPVMLFDYTTIWAGDTMTSRLVSYDESGQPTRYIETWRFTDDDHYAWQLHDAATPTGDPIMGGTVERRRD